MLKVWVKLSTYEHLTNINNNIELPFSHEHSLVDEFKQINMLKKSHNLNELFKDYLNTLTDYQVLLAKLSLVYTYLF